MKKALLLIPALVFVFISCSKKNDKPLRYFEVGISSQQENWRDTSFVVATSNEQLIAKISEQLKKPVAQRQIVTGELVKGNGGYNKNASHSFGWHFKEDNWSLTDMSIEIYDGRAYSDLDLNPNYWFNQMKRFAPWSSYIKREISKP
jgi:hypothetical protein